MSARDRDSPFLHWAKGLGVAAAAATSACLLTNPLEVAKTRMQLQGELSAAQRPFRNPFQALGLIASTEGIRGLQGGLGPAIGYQVSMNGVRLGSYDAFKTLFGAEPDASFAFLRKVSAGALCGVVGGLIGNPFFLAKVRLQNQSSNPLLQVGYRHAHRGLFDSFVYIYKSEGLSGFLRGSHSQMMRVGVGSSVQLSVYDSIKHSLLDRTSLQDDIYLHLIASSISGFFVTVAMNPFDLVATRLYNQEVVNGVGRLYTGPIDCLIKTIRTEGLLALYKGFGAHYIRLCPHTILTFVFWERYQSIAIDKGWINN